MMGEESKDEIDGLFPSTSFRLLHSLIPSRVMERNGMERNHSLTPLLSSLLLSFIHPAVGAEVKIGVG